MGMGRGRVAHEKKMILDMLELGLLFFGRHGWSRSAAGWVHEDEGFTQQVDRQIGDEWRSRREDG